MSLLFRNFYLLDGSMKKAQRADMLVEDSKITRIAPPNSIEPGRNTIWGDGERAVIPGFFNAHCHAAMTLLRGLGEELPLMDWLEQRVWPIEEHLSPEIVYAGTWQAVYEMMMGGITGFADMYFYMDQVSRVANECGMRTASSVGVSFKDENAFKKTVYRDFSEFGGPLVLNNFDPHAPYTVKFEYMQAVAEEAKKKNMPVQTHFLEAEWEREYIAEKFGMTPIRYLERTGLIDVPRLILAHGVQLNAEEIEYLSAHDNVTVVHCPASNLKLGSGIAPLPEMLEAGVHVALGTDGAASNNRLDLWNEMRLASLIHKGAQHNPVVAGSGDLLRMATYEGARAFGFEKTGMLREGWYADLAVIDLSSPRYIGADEENLSGYITYAGCASDVSSVYLNGRCTIRGREFMPREADEVLNDARAMRQKLMMAAAGAGTGVSYKN